MFPGGSVWNSHWHMLFVPLPSGSSVSPEQTNKTSFTVQEAHSQTRRINGRIIRTVKCTLKTPGHQRETSVH